MASPNASIGATVKFEHFYNLCQLAIPAQYIQMPVVKNSKTYTVGSYGSSDCKLHFHKKIT